MEDIENRSPYGLNTSVVMACSYNKRRSAVTFFNNHASQLIYLSDKQGVSSTSYKWILRPYDSIEFIRNDGDHPERAFYAIASGSSTTFVIGAVYDET